MKSRGPFVLQVKMMKTKKVILFIVEGMSDKTVLSGLLPKIFGDYVFRFKIIHGDLLTQSSISRNEILVHVNKQLSYAMSEYKYRPEDIKEVVHLVDLDAVYIDPANIIERASISRVYYTNDKMYVKDYGQIIKRNQQKTSNLSRLIEASYLKRGSVKIPYSLYYMSINLDHVIADNPNLNNNYDKARVSYEFVEKYRRHEGDFIAFTKDNLLKGQDDYVTSWRRITQSEVALMKTTNIYHYLKRLLVIDEAMT